MLAEFDPWWPVLIFVVAGFRMGGYDYGEPQWLTAQYAKAKRSSNAQNVREQEREEARPQWNVAIAVEVDR